MQIEAAVDQAGLAGKKAPLTYSVSSDVLMVAQPSGPGAEGVRALRTRLVASHIEVGRRALALCAASAGVGCTFVATNLAIALSQIGVKTLLVDADMRRPGVDLLLQPSARTEGLMQCLSTDDTNYSSYIEADIMPNLSVMYAGGTPDNPQELLAGARFEELMNFCLRDYEMTIIDTPPTNVCADGRRVSTVAGYSVVVARRNHSRIDDLKLLIEQLRHDRASVVGTILNEI